MKGKFFKQILIVLLICAAGFNLIASQGGIATRTGGPSETNCTSCHSSFTLNSGSGSLVLSTNIPAAGYAPSTTYTISVATTHSGMSVFGLDCIVLNSSNASTGTVTITNTTGTKTLTGSNSRTNVVHRTNGGLASGAKTFTFNWTSPSSNIGNITIYAATVAGNNNGNEFGDYVYTSSLVLTPAVASNIATGTISGSPFCSGQTGISIPFTVTGNFNSGNTFTAQLSDALGSFASPTTIGTLSGTSSGTILSSTGLPTTAGSLYRIRVIGSNPSTTGNDNGTNLTINLGPTTANAGLDQSVCDTTAVLAANTPTSGSGVWTLISGGGTYVNTASPNTTINGLGIGPNTLVWTITGTFCNPSRDTVIITRKVPPTLSNAGLDQTSCITSATLQGNTPLIGSGLWTLLSGAASITSPSSPTSGVTAMGAGANKFIWTIGNSPCAASRDTVIITQSGNITIANAGADQHVCVSNATLAANAPTSGTGSWSLFSGTGTITDVNNPNSTITGLGDGPNKFIWTISNGICNPSVDTVIITKDLPPTPANAGADQNVCTSTAQLNGNTPTSGAGSWSLLSGGGTILNGTLQNSTVISLPTGTSTFLWTISNGSCSPSIDTVNIIRAGTITVANAGGDQNVCGTSATLSGNTALSGTGTWTLLSGSGSITSTTNPTSAVTALGSGNNTFLWSISNGICVPSMDTVVITRKDPPTIANAGIDQTLCATTTSLSANTAISGIGKWTIVSGVAVLNDTLNPAATLSSMGIGDLFLKWTIANAPCVSSVDTVVLHNCNSNSITIDSVPIGPFCNSTGYSLTVPFHVTGTFTGFYSIELSDSSGSFTNAATIGAGSNSPISCVISSNSNKGNNYKIRVKNSYPPTVSAAGTKNLAINTCIPNTITTGAIGGSPFCLSTKYTTLVPFNITGSFQGVYQVQLSDANGVFTNPITIGTGFSSPISVNIPVTMSNGMGYRIRVCNIEPAVNGTNNGTDLEINTCITILFDTIQGSPFCANTSYQFNIPFTRVGNITGAVYADLSDSLGSFINATTLTYGYNSPLVGNMPSRTPKGTGYRIRLRNNVTGIRTTGSVNPLEINTCQTNGIDQIESTIFNVFPNPSTGKFIIKQNRTPKPSDQVIINNLLGQEVHAEWSVQNDEIYVRLIQFEPGVYIIHLQNESENIYHQIVLQ